MEDKKYTCSDMPKLCSCPFCGSENITIRYGVFGCTSNVHYPNETGFVACLKCGARTLKTGRAKNAVKKWNARKESNAAAPKWISVNDDEPELGVNVLTVDGYGHIHTACRVDENIYWREDVDGYLAYFSASYWMPLPEAPKEE